MGNFALAAALTFAIPIGTLLFVCALGFYQRKPMTAARRSPLYPLTSIPQRRYDLAIVAALNARQRRQLVAQDEEKQAVAERPVGGL